MVDEDKQDKEETTEPVKTPDKRKLWLMIGGGVILLLLAVGVPLAILSLGKGKAPTEAEADLLRAYQGLEKEGALDEDEFDEGEEPLGALFPLDAFVVNLADPGSYLRCQIQLEFRSREVPRRFYTRLVPVRDALLDLLAARSAEEINTPRGRDKLKLDIRETINNLLRREEVKNVYFTQFVVQ